MNAKRTQSGTTTTIVLYYPDTDQWYYSSSVAPKWMAALFRRIQRKQTYICVSGKYWRLYVRTSHLEICYGPGCHTTS